MSARTILHVRLDGLHAALAERTAPCPDGAAFVVASANAGGRVLDVSAGAARAGVRPGMAPWQARAVCPGVQVLPPEGAAHEAACRGAVQAMLAFTPQVMVHRPGEVFMDVTGSLRLFGGEEALVRGVLAVLAAELDIRPTAGVARNVLVARIATLLASPGEVGRVVGEPLADALAPMPVGLLWTASGDVRRRLLQMGVRTFGTLQRIPSVLLVSRFGQAGRMLFEAARGRDDTVVPVNEAGDPALSIRCMVEFPRPTRESGVLHEAALKLAARLARSLRQQGRSARRLTLDVTCSDGRRLSRARTLPQPDAGETDLAAHVGEMLAGMVTGARRCVAAELVALDLLETPAARQLSLFGAGPEREQALGIAGDALAMRLPPEPVAPASLEGSGLRVVEV